MSALTPNKGYVRPTINGDINQWGTELNRDLSIIDKNMGATVTLNVAGSSNVAVSGTDAQNYRIVLSGLLTGNIQVALPGGQRGFWEVENATTGAFTATVITSAGGSTGIAVPQGYGMLLVSDGTNIYPQSTGVDHNGNIKVAGTALAVGTVTATTISATSASITAQETVGTLVVSTSATIATAGTTGNQALNYSQFAPTANSMNLPGGVYWMQWGRFALTGLTTAVTFGTAFSAVPVFCTGSLDHNSASSQSQALSSMTKNGFDFTVNGFSAPAYCDWIAVGKL